MATVTLNLDLGLIAIGDIIEIPTGTVTNDGVSTVTGVKVVVEYPVELQYDSSILTTGNYNTGTDEIENITLLPGGTFSGIVKFVVVDDTDAIFRITFTATTDDACETCLGDNVYCVVTSGLTCTQINSCISTPQIVTYYFCENTEDNVIEIGEEYTCPGDTVRTFSWTDTTNSYGTLTGTPDAGTYTPDANFVGAALASYEMLCDGIQVGTGQVFINVKADGATPVTTYADQATNLVITLDGTHRILHIDPTTDITVTINVGDDTCETVTEIEIKHIGTGDNRYPNIRVYNGSGDEEVDLDDYFEFDNSGWSQNNPRGYNLSHYIFYYDGDDALFVKSVSTNTPIDGSPSSSVSPSSSISSSSSSSASSSASSSISSSPSSSASSSISSSPSSSVSPSSSISSSASSSISSSISSSPSSSVSPSSSISSSRSSSISSSISSSPSA